MSAPIIRVVDLETTGFETPEHAPVEIGWCDLQMREDFAGDPIPDQVFSGDSWLCNPGRTIPPEASAVHHIIDSDVADAPPFESCAPLFNLPNAGKPIIAFAAHNAKFERLFIPAEWTDPIPWVCTYKAALRIWPDAPSHSNQALRYWRKPDGLDREIANKSHRAYPDAYVTAFLLRDMLQDHPLADLIKWSTEPALQVRCHIGKWRGKPWREVDDGYLEWVSTKDFDEDVLFTVRHEMTRREEERKKALP